MSTCTACVYEREHSIVFDRSKTAPDWEAATGIGRSAVLRHLKHAPVADPPTEPVAATYKFERGADDFSGNSPASETPQTVDDVEKFVRDKGMVPSEWDLQWRFSEWEQSSKLGETKTLHAFRVSGKRKVVGKNGVDPTAAMQSVIDSIKSFTYIPEPVAYNPESAVIMPSDLQIGKVDWNGDTKDTIAQALHSFHEFARFVKEFKPAEICMVDAGDVVENVMNTSSQLGTNDLDLPHQIAAGSHVFLEGIKLFAPLAPRVSFKAVTSNHGAFRIGPKSPGGDAHSDFGIVIAEMLRDALTLNPEAFHHVSVQTPDPYMESLYFQTSGTDIGVVHSHQAGNVDKIGTWWQGQSHGNLPVAKARILLCGHWHSTRIQQSGDSRWIFVGPSSDRGSTWFTNLKGEQSQSGMLTFTTSNNHWDNLRVL